MPQDGIIRQTEKRNRGSSKKVLFVAAGLFVISAALAGAAYYYWKGGEEKHKSEELVTAEENQELVSRVSELIVLPTDEQPTIATVADPEQLKDQSFFANAKKGDKVLIYTKARKAVLYDPAAHRIVEVAPLNLGETAGVTTNPPTSP